MEILLESLGIILFFEFFLFTIAYFTKRNDVADVGWGLGFGVLALFNFFNNSNTVFFQRVLLILILAWSLRLAGYMGYRMVGKAEDQRYQEMRAGWKGNQVLKTLFYVFLLQGFLLWILAIPLIQYLSSPDFTGSNLTWIAVTISVFGLVYETVSDLQKSKFKAVHRDPESFIDTGLFKFSRYPQYFGEIMFWLGVALFPMSWGPQLFLVYAPIFLAILLLKISGVPLLEKKYLKRKGYVEYAKRTPLLIPHFFKSN